MSTIRLAQHAGHIFIVRTAMSPTQVHLVQNSFRRLTPQLTEASRLFYEELFRLAPDVRTHFPDDLTKQKDKFAQMMAVIIKNLSQVGNISDDIIDLGRRHMAYDIESEHYETVGEALLRMLDKLLGAEMTAEIRDAWAAVYDMLSCVMQDAANTPRSSESFFARIIRDVMTAHYGLTLRSEATGISAAIAKEIESGKVIKLS